MFGDGLRRLPLGRRVPHLSEKIGTGEDPPGEGSQVGEEIQLATGELHRPAIGDDHTGRDIDGEPLVVQRRWASGALLQ